MNITPQKYCPVCKRYYPATTDFFHRNSSHKDGFNSYCKVCDNKRRHEQYEKSKGDRHEQSISLVAKSVLGSPDQCGACKTKKGNIFGDVNESTQEKYGYLCTKCYRLVREFRGDATRIRNVLSYVERTR